MARSDVFSRGLNLTGAALSFERARASAFNGELRRAARRERERFNESRIRLLGRVGSQLTGTELTDSQIRDLDTITSDSRLANILIAASSQGNQGSVLSSLLGITTQPQLPTRADGRPLISSSGALTDLLEGNDSVIAPTPDQASQALPSTGTAADNNLPPQLAPTVSPDGIDSSILQVIRRVDDPADPSPTTSGRVPSADIRGVPRPAAENNAFLRRDVIQEQARAALINGLGLQDFSPAVGTISELFGTSSANVSSNVGITNPTTSIQTGPSGTGLSPALQRGINDLLRTTLPGDDAGPGSQILFGSPERLTRNVSELIRRQGLNPSTVSQQDILDLIQ